MQDLHNSRGGEAFFQFPLNVGKHIFRHASWFVGSAVKYAHRCLFYHIIKRSFIALSYNYPFRDYLAYQKITLGKSSNDVLFSWRTLHHGRKITENDENSYPIIHSSLQRRRLQSPWKVGLEFVGITWGAFGLFWHVLLYLLWMERRIKNSLVVFLKVSEWHRTNDKVR